MNCINQENSHTHVTSILETAPYQSDPLSVYQSLCHDKQNNILLESAEIDKKHLLKSLLLTDAALKIVCKKNHVTFSSLSLNGQEVIPFVVSQLEQHAKLTLSEDKKELIAVFPEVAEDLDEKSRLMATNSFQSLRLFNKLSESNKHPFAVFLGGVFAFDMISVSETLPEVEGGENTCPDFVYYLAQTMVIIDHEKKYTEIIGNAFSTCSSNSAEDNIHSLNEVSTRVNNIKQLLSSEITEQVSPQTTTQTTTVKSLNETPVDVDITDHHFCEIVEQLKENIRAGDIFQVVPSRTFSLPCSDATSAYKALKKSNPSPYMFYLNDSEFCIFGASPESAIKYQNKSVEGDRLVEIYPIAGTRPRGFDSQGNFSLDLDSRIELELRQDKKESAEHIMLVDLARNDIARVSKPGTRHVADLLKVDRYSHVMHLVSRVCGTLKEELDALHAYQACMNMGTLSGAPKIKATSLIREVEKKRRGSYGGAVGYITGLGEMDTCIVIRSAFVKDHKAYIQAGAGVVYDSIPQAEADETRQKAQAVINAILTSNASLGATCNSSTHATTQAKGA
ncbi:MAG: anthranilate synthase component 1 [Colwellia sp.]